MKVMCVTYDYKGPYSSFSVSQLVNIGEWYQASDKGDYYLITFSDESFCNLAKSYFRTLSEIRNEKLIQLL